MSQHYHSVDTVNGERHYHADITALTLYMQATGEGGIKTTNCYDPSCADDEPDAYCSACDAECSGH